MECLQYAALRKVTGAVLGSRMTTVERIAGVEPAEVHLDALQTLFVASGIADSTIVGEALKLVIEGKRPGSLEEEMVSQARGEEGGEPSWGGKCPRTEMEIIDLECNEGSSIGA